MDQPDEAWLLALAARIDEGRPIDWARVESAAGPADLDVVRALQVLEAVARRGRDAGVAVQSAAVTVQPPPEPPPPTASPAGSPPQDGPLADRYRSAEPSPPEEIHRKLLFGVALLLAVASMLVGLLVQVPVLQYGLIGLAVLVVFIALLTGAKPPAPPSDGTAPPGGPGA